MTTTIKIDAEVKKELDKQKDATHKTYNDIIKKLIKINEPNLSEMYGKYPQLPKWNKKQDRDSKRDA